MLQRPAVFVDRDGTLNHQIVRAGKPYPPSTLNEFRLFAGVPAACAQLQAASFVLVVVTNQPDVGRGTQTQAAVEAMHALLRRMVPYLERIEVCYAPGQGHDHPENRRRKPAAGMLLDAAAALDLDLNSSWMVGDRWSDIEAGHAAGCQTILIDHGYGERAPITPPQFTVKSFVAATSIILAHPRR